MSENTGNKKLRPPKKSGHPSGSSGKRTGVNLKKKKKHAGKLVEMSTGDQVSIDEIMNENTEEAATPAPKPKKPKPAQPDNTEPDADTHSFGDSGDSDSFSDTLSGVSGQINWKKQVGSIGVWMFSVIMLALTFFPGENLWNIFHRLILGILGFKAFLWAGLLIFFGYLLTKQISEDDILDIIRPTSGIILLSDVLGYILIQSDGYRSVYNELSYNLLPLFNQMLKDGEKVGGSGLLGGVIGELFILFAGKTGAAIITIILMSALIMILSKTGPLQLFEQAKMIIRSLLDPDFYKKLFEGEQEQTSFSDFSDMDAIFETEETTDVEIPPTSDDFLEFAEKGNITDAATDSEQGEESLSEIVKAVSLKKKKKKLTRAEEIKAESDEFSKQVESSEESSTDETNKKDYKYPTVRLLVPPKNSGSADDGQELTETAQNLIKTLAEYGVQASISHISRGPTVTRYEIKPAPGVKINKIKNLSDDIALRLAAQSIRIEAPIPGKAAVGIEIPNKNKQMVRIREILDSQEFAEAKGSLTVALGKDIEGNNVLCDLSKMPHLLIAGSTGSGKSVCVNSMLISLLYKYSPDDVRMVLIDPKSVEFDMYNGIPHLLVPVVCEPKKAAGALQWAVSEMLKRYAMLKEHGARNIDGYNHLAEQTHEFEKLCRIVIVIDEMADLMIASPKEVEDSIARLAAMARAAGMYMVLATQRPSVDVITGTIKNNIPSRIALAVSSQVDSRTILDEGGAENLIGYGDMLFHPMGTSKHIRIQGCFVEDAEVERVIRFVKQNGLAEYDDSIADEIERNSLDSSGEGAAEFEGKDEFFEKAVEVVTEAGQASTSMLQRRLGVGYARAGRIIDQLEEHGIIGPHEGSKPRAVLITRTQWLEMTMNRTHSGKNDPLIRNHGEFAAQTLDAGHEEITARQREFFNADSDDDFAPEDDLFEASSDAEETLSESDDRGEDVFDDSESDDSEDYEEQIDEKTQDDMLADDISEINPAEDIIDVEFEDDAQDVTETSSAAPVEEEQDMSLFTSRRKPTAPSKPTGSASTGKNNPVSLQKSAQTPKPSEEPSASKKKKAAKASSPRDLSIFFDDEPEQIDDFFDFSQDKQAGNNKSASKQAQKKSAAQTDIPPWEEAPLQDASQNTEESGDDAGVFSERGDIPPWQEPSIPTLSEILPEFGEDLPSLPETDNASLPESDSGKHTDVVADTEGNHNDNSIDSVDDADSNKDDKSDYDDDDFFDDVMSSPWIKKL